MSDAEQIMDRMAEKQGWSTDTRLELALRYIEQQESPDAFEDFLVGIAETENDLGYDLGDDPVTTGDLRAHMMAQHAETDESLTGLLSDVRADHPSFDELALLELVHNRQHTSLDWHAEHDEDSRSTEPLIEVSLEITNVYDGEEIETSWAGMIPPPPNGDLEDADWESEALISKSGTGRTKGEAGYFVKVVASSRPDLIPVGHEAEAYG